MDQFKIKSIINQNYQHQELHYFGEICSYWFLFF